MRLHRKLLLIAGFASALVWSISPASLLAQDFTQTNLISDIPGLGAVTDPNLVDPWGVSFSAGSPFWVSDNVTDLATVYTGAPSISSTVVSVPGGPTGQVNNGNTSAFILSDGKSASFIFDTQAGTIAAWNSGLGTVSATPYTNSAASYTGLAIGTNGGNTYLYAANGNGAGSIDVFNSSFAPVNLGSSSFVDPNLPANYVPYNIQLIGSQLYVTYVIYDSMGNETPSGVVDIFNTNGAFVSRFSSGGPLDAPWGITLAPSGFGQFGGDILIGNFLNGEINAFNSTTGAYLGTLDGNDGNPISDPGLWALEFRTAGASSTNPEALYFTAGINDETDGLLGEITETPEPSSFILAGLGVLALTLTRLRPQAA
jgi:uncharacterized protein (TIGR03118 family)